ncbi:hypothetical protein Nepgr_006164 [Nepenthes gracilis]|uniref:Uncharacterized protein n=1 Tax=Nepenthes gracilis TaxID=150966 RepID=A0AAD3S511_NEPGR|nr:hypothetical protein Nepgr_006164 [Nepenthes gracilis]
MILIRLFAILRSKKIEALVLYRDIVHAFNSVNNLELKVLLASPSAYSANPKTKSLNAPMLIGSAIPLVTVVRARVFWVSAASKKDQTQLWANPSTSYSLIPVAEFVEAFRQSRYGNSIKFNPISSPLVTQPSSSPDLSLPTMKGYGGAASILGVMAIILQMRPLGNIGKVVRLEWVQCFSCGFVCSNHDKRGKCCRYIITFVAVSIGHYANATSNLGVDSDVSEVYFHSVLRTLEFYGVPPNATGVTLEKVIAKVVEFASCLFGAPRLSTAVSRTSSSSTSPNNSPSSSVTASPSGLSLSISNNESRHPYHLTFIPGVAIVVTAISVMLLLVLIFLIHRKGRELDNSHSLKPSKDPLPLLSGQTIPGGLPMFWKFSYKETKKATNNFSTVVGQGGFATYFIIASRKLSEGFALKRKRGFSYAFIYGNGSLKDYLHSLATPLSWQMRILRHIDVANARVSPLSSRSSSRAIETSSPSNIPIDEDFVSRRGIVLIALLQRYKVIGIFASGCLQEDQTQLWANP